MADKLPEPISVTGNAQQTEQHTFPQAYDESRWALAAAAARRVIDMDLAGGPLYRLYAVEADEQTPLLPEMFTINPIMKISGRSRRN